MSELLSNTERTIEAFFNSLLHTDGGPTAVEKQTALKPAGQQRVAEPNIATADKHNSQAPVLDVEAEHPRAKPVSDLLKQAYQPAPSVLKQADETLSEPHSADLAQTAEEPSVAAEISPVPAESSVQSNEELESFEWMLAESGLEQLAGEIIPPQVQTAEPAEDEFQTLYFEVAGLTLALPLKELGGILTIKKVNSLFGKPAWFKGTMLSRGEQHHVVDTALWVMPEKYTPELADQINYQYLIMLKDSQWGLACEKLLTAEALSREKVKWRQITGRRPWLAGMVIDRMCALLNVDALIELLSQGADS